MVSQATGITRTIELPGGQNWCQWSSESRGVFILSDRDGAGPDVLYWDVEVWAAVDVSTSPGVDIYIASVPALASQGIGQ